MPCGPVANRVPYPLVADGLSAGIPISGHLTMSNRFYSLRSTATATAAISSPSTGGCSFGVFQSTVCFRTTCTLFPLPILRRERVPTYATHEKRKLSLRIFQINRELAFGRTLILPTHPLARAISQVWQFPLCRYRHGYPRPHEVILPEVIIVLHFSPCWYLLRTFLRSDKLRPNGGKLLPPFQSSKNWKALDPTVMSRTTCCATTMNSQCQIPRSGTASSTCGDVYINFVKDLL
jgi:hypothetical protein